MGSHRKSGVNHPAYKGVSGKTLGNIRNKIGREREEAVLHALQEEGGEPPVPEWVRLVVLATPEEDRRGIDVILHTDVGKIYLQVKGSRKAIREFHNSHPKGNIVPLMVNRVYDLADLRRSIIPRLIEERERILKLRST